MSGRKRAAFLDRDGTLIEDAQFLARPDDIVVLPGAFATVARLNASGVPVVVITNQSGIARGLMSEDDYEAVAARMTAMFADAGARIDATYHCPHHPAITGTCECRKPGLGMYERAIAELVLDPTRSLFVGDRYRDVEPGLKLRGRGILVPSVATPPDDLGRAERDAEVAPTLDEAVDRWLRNRAP